ncbi:ribosomal small subunit pseudouridine synthase A [Gracilibacillus ureilyticus]|uniref:Pseudouridine synthase n=1 Tax=Gracilibacillus ureilyticus TaxID=531814 RepID=A0A1H9TFF6_9BACI|nr:pseudouridine synthase [Gracilibacillus ureilyticus]SER95343.1 ribosomal small subunit pseudouridine synthase A [Gracilibacillus ureilyticus]
MRLDKLLANTGYGSRKDVKQMIKKRLVKVNDEIVKKADLDVNPVEDIILCNGEKVSYQEYVYFMLHKPPGYLSATEDSMQKTVLDLLDEKDRVLNPFPVGRLDKDTEGLLLISNDGHLAHELLSPKKHVSKKYFARIKGEVKPEHIEQFKKGVDIGGYITKSSGLTILSSGTNSEVEIVITEGKFHQVKRMFQAIDTEVLYLKRLSMGSLVLDKNLPVGKYRQLTDEELSLLKE